MAAPYYARTVLGIATRCPRRSAVDAIAFQRRSRGLHPCHQSLTSIRKYHPSSANHQASPVTSEAPTSDDQWIPFDSPVDAGRSHRNLPDSSLPPPFTPPPPPEPVYTSQADSLSLSDDIEKYSEDSSLDEPEIAIRNPPETQEKKARPVSPPRGATLLQTQNGKRQQTGGKKRMKASRKADQKDEDNWGLYKTSPIEGAIFTGVRAKKKRTTTADVEASREDVIAIKQKMAEPQFQKVTSPKREDWQLQKNALHEKLDGEAWNPRKRLSPDALDGIRAMNAQYPKHFTTPVLAQHFKVSPEAIRRILKSKWRPNTEEEEDRKARWDRRGEKIWSDLVDKGVHAPKKWRDMGIGRGPRKRPQILFPTPQDRRKAKKTGNSSTDEATSAWLESLSQRVA